LHTIANAVAKSQFIILRFEPSHVNEGRKRERCEREGEKDNQTTDPTLSLLKAIMVRAVDDFVVDSFRSVTRSFLFFFFFFCYINDLELLLNDLQNRLYMAKV
jgi:hypothetical protein